MSERLEFNVNGQPSEHLLFDVCVFLSQFIFLCLHSCTATKDIPVDLLTACSFEGVDCKLEKNYTFCFVC